MSDLKNPMRFAMRHRTVDIDTFLHRDGFPNKRVTKIEIRPSEGDVYIHWEVNAE